MSENQSRGIRDFSIYDSMKTEELEEILRLDCEADEGQESDTELLFYVMGVLAERKKNSNTQEITAQQAWESFQSNYLPECEEASAQVPKKSIKFTGSWLRRMVAAAAVIALLVGIPLTVSAFGWEDIWNAVATWAKETFSFVTGDQTDNSEPHKVDTRQFTSLQQALSETGLESDFIPTWIPKRYKFEEIQTDETPKRKTYIAVYTNGEPMLRICIQSYLGSDPENIEISDDLVEIYEVAGTKYYIFSNHRQFRAVWIVDSYECYISGDLTIDEIKLMIDSIGKG